MKLPKDSPILLAVNVDRLTNKKTLMTSPSKACLHSGLGGGKLVYTHKHSHLPFNSSDAIHEPGSEKSCRFKLKLEYNWPGQWLQIGNRTFLHSDVP